MVVSRQGNTRCGRSVTADLSTLTMNTSSGMATAPVPVPLRSQHLQQSWHNATTAEVMQLALKRVMTVKSMPGQTVAEETTPAETAPGPPVFMDQLNHADKAGQTCPGAQTVTLGVPSNLPPDAPLSFQDLGAALALGTPSQLSSSAPKLRNPTSPANMHKPAGSIADLGSPTTAGAELVFDIAPRLGQLDSPSKLCTVKDQTSTQHSSETCAMCNRFDTSVGGSQDERDSPLAQDVKTSLGSEVRTTVSQSINTTTREAPAKAFEKQQEIDQDQRWQDTTTHQVRKDTSTDMCTYMCADMCADMCMYMYAFGRAWHCTKCLTMAWRIMIVPGERCRVFGRCAGDTCIEDLVVSLCLAGHSG